MIVVRYGRRPVLMKPADDGGDGGGGDAGTLNIDDGDGGEDVLTGNEDRGDELDPQLDVETLNRVAGEGGDDDGGDGGGNDTQAGATGSDAGGKKGSTSVPIGRFNEVNEERKRLERENEELRKRGAAAPAPAAAAPAEPEKPKFDERAAWKEHAQLLAEGEFDKAADKAMEINKHVKDAAREEAENNVRAELAQRETVQTLTQVANKAVERFPYLDTEAGAEAMELIMAARDRFAAGGMPVAQALAKAVDQIAPKFAPAATPAAPSPPGKGSTGKTGGEDTRSQQANARGAADSTRQPPRLDGGAGNRTKGATVDVEDMTDEQFDALPEAEKRRLRGDEG